MPARATPSTKGRATSTARPRRTAGGLSRTSPREERAPVIIRRLKRAYPGAKVALNFSNPLECLVATILSAQCTDERVNQVTKTLFRKYRSPEDYLKVPESELAADIKPTGFFNQKARSFRGACRKIVEDYGGQVPQTIAELITLPGVARKTANIVQGNSFPERHRKDPDAGIAVDTHVRRVAQRLGFTDQSDPDKIERDLMALIPRRDWFSFTYVLIEHGRTVCKAPTPRCEVCPVNDLCPSSRV
jgi:endonuclease-3